MQKILLPTLRLGVLFALLVVSGCGGGGGQESHKAYTLQFNWVNTSPVAVRMFGQDKDEGGAAGETDVVTVPALASSTHHTTTGTYTASPTTNISVSVTSASGEPLTHVDANGIHLAEGRTTLITVTYDGTTLTVEATVDA